MNRKTLIVYEDDASDLAETAQALFRAAEKVGGTARLRGASAVTVSEILAANLYVFGVKNPTSTAYAEIRRLIKGINLAGRKAVFFRTKDARGSDALKASLADSDIALPVPDLDISSGSAKITAWTKAAMDL